MTQTYRGWTIPDVYADRGGDLDACPECAGPKTKHGAMCIACRRRIGRFARPVAERFWEKVDKNGPVVRPDLGPCWIWTGAKSPLGYGVLHSGRRDEVQGRLAHRVAYTLSVGPIPDELKACHHCDNPPCVRPDHLFIGTQGDNIRDASAKGRLRRRAA